MYKNIDIYSWDPKLQKDIFYQRAKFKNNKVHHMYLDTELNYANIRHIFPTSLKELYDSPIEYKWNNDTFRDYREFSETNDGHIAIGDSFTEGEGLPYNLLWHSLLEEKIGVPIFNLGMCATGFDEWFLVLMRYMDKFKGDKIFLLSHLFSRYNFPVKDYYMNPNHEDMIKDIWNTYIVSDEYTAYNYQIKLLALTQLAASKGKKLITVNLHDVVGHDTMNYNDWFYNKEEYKGTWELARDGKHLGPNFQSQVCQRFIDLLE